MNELWKAIDQHGIALVALIALSLAFYKKGWPWIEKRFEWFEKQVEKQREDAKKDQREFLDALARRDESFQEIATSLKTLACHNLAAAKKRARAKR